MIPNGLPRLGSDHVPIRLEVGSHSSSPRPFKFELVWAFMDGFQELVNKWCSDTTSEGYDAFIFSTKLAFLRDQLRHWAKYSFGSIKLKKLPLLQDLEELDIAKEKCRLTPSEASHEQELQERLGEILK